jgi:ketosteroid isomerase-like protein
VSVFEDRTAALEEGFNCLERGDLDAFMVIVEANSKPDCEFTSAIGAAMSNSVFRGFDGIRAWFAELLETVGEPRWKDRRYEQVSDDAFLFFASFEMKGAASGIPLRTEIGQLFELEDGLFVRGTSYTSHAEARRAAEALRA